MHSLAKERIDETEALADVVEAVRKFVRGEIMAAGFKAVLAKKQAEENKKLEAELEEVRMKQAIKDKLAKKMNVTSINGDENESLLGDDADEEIRMTDRLIEKSESTEAPEKRLDADAIARVQSALKGTIDNKRSGSNASISSKMSRRSGSVGSVGSINSVNKFDPKLKQ